MTMKATKALSVVVLLSALGIAQNTQNQNSQNQDTQNQDTQNQDTQNQDAQSKDAQSKDAQTQEAQTQPATDGHFVVGVHRFQDFPFAVGEGVKEVRLSGSFRATGGNFSKIYLLVLTDDQYTEWQKPHSTASTPENGRALYNSGDVSGGTVNLRVPDNPANYHVVFNNTPFSFSKAIQTDLKWQWSESQ